MLIPDILLSLSLIVFVVVWFRRTLSRRELLLRTVLIIAILAAIWGLTIDRWQTSIGGLGAMILMLILLFRRKPPNAQTGVPYVSGTLFALGAAAAIAIIYMFPIQHLPKPSGPNAVGVSTFELRDESRPGVFLARPDEPRRLLVRTWYPAKPETGSKPEKYFNALEASSTARGLGELLGFPPLLTYIRHVKTHSYKNAPLLKMEGRFKSVIFSHGYGSFPQQNTALMEHLASQGYVVFAIQHTYDSSATAFPNGDTVPMDPGFVTDNLGETPQRFSYSEDAGDRWSARLKMQQNYQDEGLRFTQSSAPVWLDDQRFVVDQLQSGTVPDHVAELVRRSELDRVAVIGMSFGGSTAGAFCLRDERCVAGVNMDGLDIHFRATNQNMNTPFLMLHTDLNGFGRMIGAPKDTRLFGFNEFAYARFEDAGTASDIIRLEVKGVLHLGFSDFTLFMRRPLRDLMLGSGKAERIIDIQNDVILDFLDQSFNVSGSEFPSAVLEKHAGHIVEMDNSAVRAWWTGLTSEQKDDIRTEIEAFSGN